MMESDETKAHSGNDRDGNEQTSLQNQATKWKVVLSFQTLKWKIWRLTMREQR